MRAWTSSHVNCTRSCFYESTKKVIIKSIYKDSDESRHDAKIFSLATNLGEAWPRLRKVCSLQDNSIILNDSCMSCPILNNCSPCMFHLIGRNSPSPHPSSQLPTYNGRDE